MKCFVLFLPVVLSGCVFAWSGQTQVLRHDVVIKLTRGMTPVQVQEVMGWQPTDITIEGDTTIWKYKQESTFGVCLVLWTFENTSNACLVVVFKGGLLAHVEGVPIKRESWYGESSLKRKEEKPEQ